MSEALLKLSEGWAKMAYLYTCGPVQPAGCIEEALTWAIFYLWASEEAV